MQMPVPDGYQSVEHDDGVVHAIDLAKLKPGVQPARNTPVCGRATGPSSDEAGEMSWDDKLDITCWECISILG